MPGDGHRELPSCCLLVQCSDNCLIIHMEDHMLVLPEVTSAEDGMQNCVDFLELDIVMVEAARNT